MRLLVAVVFLFLVGCGSTMTRKMDSQVGVMTMQDAVVRWGEPAYQRKTADGGTEMVWRSRMEVAAQSQYVHPRGPTYGGTAAAAGEPQRSAIGDGSAQQRGETLTVFFDKRGIMERWDSQRR